MIENTHVFYGFSGENEPVCRVKSGDTITIETVDAFGGQIKAESDILDT